MKVAIFDTQYVTDNLGDQIIMRAVNAHLRDIFPDAFFTGIPSHDFPGPVARRTLRESESIFVGGTNILCSHVLWYSQWKLRQFDVMGTTKPILMGVGWHKYQSRPDPYTQLYLNNVLSKDRLHSVRDEYTAKQLNSVGFSNIVNTGCPTMWDLDDAAMSNIPGDKKDSVLFTLTCYLKQPEVDRAFIQLLQKHYKEVYFWPQMHGDIAYLETLGLPPVINLAPSMQSVTELFSSGTTDYIGLRLHCGIFALQQGVRSLTVIIDNRAAEIARDTGLPAVKRGDLEGVEAWIKKSDTVRLRLPHAEIEKWKRQFH
jgi:polysaccharide pyruvyl transferase WcaK-like protein